MKYSNRQERAQLIFIFFLVATCFFIVRSTAGLVWNDSPQTAENQYGFHDKTVIVTDGKPVCRKDGAFGLHWGEPDLMKTVLTRSFSCLEFGGYRPLSSALSLTAVSIFSEVYSPTQPKPYLGKIWIAGVAALFGFLAVLLFLISRRYVQSNLAAYLILILFFCSPSIVSGAWILFSGGIQVTVPLFICLGLWLYLKTSESESKSEQYQWLWKTGLIVVLILGPWVREYIGVVSILIITLEIFKHGRPTGLLMIAIFSFVHAIFPTAIPHLFQSQLPVAPVFKLGSLAILNYKYIYPC